VAFDESEGLEVLDVEIEQRAAGKSSVNQVRRLEFRSRKA
jgi:hypothetical protein